MHVIIILVQLNCKIVELSNQCMGFLCAWPAQLLYYYLSCVGEGDIPPYYNATVATS